MPNIYIINLENLKNPDDKPYLFPRQVETLTCLECKYQWEPGEQEKASSQVKCPKCESTWKQALVENYEPCLSDVIKLILRNLPLRNIDDSAKAFSILVALKASKPNEILEFASEDLRWLNDILFNDATGKQLHEKATNKPGTGAWVAVTYGLISVPLKVALSGMSKQEIEALGLLPKPQDLPPVQSPELPEPSESRVD